MLSNYYHFCETDVRARMCKERESVAVLLNDVKKNKGKNLCVCSAVPIVFLRMKI